MAEMEAFCLFACSTLSSWFVCAYVCVIDLIRPGVRIGEALTGVLLQRPFSFFLCTELISEVEPVPNISFLKQQQQPGLIRFQAVLSFPQNQ